MTPALRLRKWGGGGGNRFSPSFILREWAGGWSGSVLLLTGAGRGLGAPAAARAPRGLLLPSPHPTPLLPHPFPRAPAARPRSRDSLAGPPERSELIGTSGGGSKARRLRALAGWPRCSPCRTRRTHFPRWLGAAAEWVGVRVGGWAGGSLPLAMRKPLRCEGRAAPRVIREERCSARWGKDAPSFAPQRGARARVRAGEGVPV